MHISFVPAHSKEDPKNLPAVAKRVDKKIDAAVDGEEEMTNQKQLGADRNGLNLIRSLALIVP